MNQEFKTRLKQISDWKKLIPNLNNLFLPEADFSSLDLSACNFYESYLPNANFKGADLKDANFSDALLTRANFQNANLENANFTNCHLVRVNFLDANLENAIFLGANLESCAYPMNCSGFFRVKHSQENISDFLALFSLLEGIDKELLNAVKPWINKNLSIPGE
jgi:uncharacterized protein YjbI with pentapeptide repeats